jgi:hypothetical protein
MLGVILGALLLLLFIGLVVLQGAIEWFGFDPDKWFESIFMKKDTGKVIEKKETKKPVKTAAKLPVKKPAKKKGPKR